MEQEEPVFSRITDKPADAIFGINDLFLIDNRKNKINLTVGILIDEEGKSAQILPSVKLAEAEILKTNITKNYLPIDGDPEYVELTKKLVFGETDYSCIYGAQTVGGTSALRILADFCKNEIGSRISMPDPTWENHENIFIRAGLIIDKYPYPIGMYEHISKLPCGSIVLLHAMCHNPTGHDLTKSEWEKLEVLFQEKKLIPFFDTAYQGFGRGLDEDAFAIRYFMEKGHECLIAHSYSKSFALYGERVGALFIVMRNRASADLIKRNIRSLIRTAYSNPPRHGSSIVKLILQDSNLRNMWEKELSASRCRIQKLRKILSIKLKGKCSHLKFPYLENGNGFFVLLGLSNEEAMRLRDEFAIYTAPKSRVNLTALNDKNIDLIVDSILRVT